MSTSTAIRSLAPPTSPPRSGCSHACARSICQATVSLAPCQPALADCTTSRDPRLRWQPLLQHHPRGHRPLPEPQRCRPQRQRVRRRAPGFHGAPRLACPRGSTTWRRRRHVAEEGRRWGLRTGGESDDLLCGGEPRQGAGDRALWGHQFADVGHTLTNPAGPVRFESLEKRRRQIREKNKNRLRCMSSQNSFGKKNRLGVKCGTNV